MGLYREHENLRFSVRPSSNDDFFPGGYFTTVCKQDTCSFFAEEYDSMGHSIRQDFYRIQRVGGMRRLPQAILGIFLNFDDV